MLKFETELAKRRFASAHPNDKKYIEAKAAEYAGVYFDPATISFPGPPPPSPDPRSRRNGSVAFLAIERVVIKRTFFGRIKVLEIY